MAFTTKSKIRGERKTKEPKKETVWVKADIPKLTGERTFACENGMHGSCSGNIVKFKRNGDLKSRTLCSCRCGHQKG